MSPFHAHRPPPGPSAQAHGRAVADRSSLPTSGSSEGSRRQRWSGQMLVGGSVWRPFACTEG
eukprot:893691-Alexandrium_andersonii.AAC.1